MNLVRCLFVAILAGMFLFPPAVSPQDPTANATADDLSRGKRLYVAQCSLCHGARYVRVNVPFEHRAKFEPADLAARNQHRLNDVYHKKRHSRNRDAGDLESERQ